MKNRKMEFQDKKKCKNVYFWSASVVRKQFHSTTSFNFQFEILQKYFDIKNDKNKWSITPSISMEKFNRTQMEPAGPWSKFRIWKGRWISEIWPSSHCSISKNLNLRNIFNYFFMNFILALLWFILMQNIKFYEKRIKNVTTYPRIWKKAKKRIGDFRPLYDTYLSEFLWRK